MQLLGNAMFANRASGQRFDRDVRLHVLLTTSVQPSDPSSCSSTVSGAGSRRFSEPGDVASSVVLTLRSDSWINSPIWFDPSYTQVFGRDLPSIWTPQAH